MVDAVGMVNVGRMVNGSGMVWCGCSIPLARKNSSMAR